MALRVVLAALLLSVAAHAEQVVRVKDGDSLVVDSAGRQVDVRLADIDAPEHRQPRGDEASALLRSLVEGREVQLQLVGGDAYRRVVAHVFVDGVDVNAELVRRGLAWVRRGYDPAPQLIRHEDEARDAQRGLWADADATPPWVWRRARRANNTAQRPAARTTSPTESARRRGSPSNTAQRSAARTTRTASARMSIAQATVPPVRCGTKRVCREMTSCGEALAFMRQCGVTSMDGDGDSVPCEHELCAP